MAEQPIRNQQVVGSTPTLGSSFFTAVIEGDGPGNFARNRVKQVFGAVERVHLDFVATLPLAWEIARSLNRDRHIPK